MHVGEPELATLETEGEALVINAQQVHDGGLQIMNVDTVPGDIEAKLVTLAMGHARLHATAGHPDREGIRVMITTPLFRVRDVTL
jgi:hypothetical protein